MTDPTDDQVKALLDGATPGPWSVEDEGDTINGIYSKIWAIGFTAMNARVGGRNSPMCGAENAALMAAAPDLARALLDARAELAQARADAKAAQALVVERFRHDLQFMVDSIAEDKAYVADKYPALFKTIQARRAEMGTLGGVQVFGEIARDLLVLAPADGLAAVEALRAEARENAMQALASMGQAQEAYEAQLEAEAELAATQTQVGDWIVRADEANVKVEKLESELARVKADAAAAQALVGTLTGAAQRLNAACDAMWNDHRRVEAHSIKECHMRAISEAQQALFPALEAAENASLKAGEEGVAMALKEFRATFCHASPGSDTEFALFLEGFDAAADIARDALAEVQARDDASTPPADTPEGRT